jgi:hypothetical protein
MNEYTIETKIWRNKYMTSAAIYLFNCTMNENIPSPYFCVFDSLNLKQFYCIDIYI